MEFNGLTQKQAEESANKYGKNTLTQLPPIPLWKKIILGFKDPMLMILCVALLVQLILFLLKKAEWYEPVGVFVAIIIANGVAAISENKQEGKAFALKAEEEAKETTKIIRDGILSEMHVSEVVTGDIIYLQAGDKIPADGEIIHGRVMVDQAVLNGETEEAEKIPNDTDEEYDIKDLLNPYYIYRGCVVCEGEAYLKVKVVGDGTLFGQLALEVQEEKRATPLQVKLGKLAKDISTFGYIGAVCIILAVIGKAYFSGTVENNLLSWVEVILNSITISVTIIVCAVPEGLPMLTSILMSFQSIRMIKDNVLVRKINGLETSGSLSILYSDKTGTITEGKLSVVEITCGNLKGFNNLISASDAFTTDYLIGTGLNNSAMESEGYAIGGNNTDRALMNFLIKEDKVKVLNKSIIEEFEAFDSAKKYSSLTVKLGEEVVSYIKGAPEIIVNKCHSYVDEKGQVKDDLNKEALNEFMNEQASRSMRLLAVAKTKGKEIGDDLTLVCILSIRDNVRPEATHAIKEVQGAGIQVVMITGDRKETAEAIAKEAGLMRLKSDVALTHKELDDMTDDEIKEILPNLRVVSRAIPTDKSRLVRLAQELDMVVGMTGDGVNDSPALKKADVGFAMGSGTEVAKAAGDITILDDNFLSIEKAILYGRTMFRSIRKFLIFQLTVNVGAVLTCFLGPLFGQDVVLTVIQLLLINLVMDTLAAIAFGSEPALKEYMKDKPIPRGEPIVTYKMYSQIALIAFYITFICLAILFIPAIKDLFENTDVMYLRSAVFATFMMAIAFNGFNARTAKLNILDKITKNVNFWIIMLLIFVLQFLFVTFGGPVLSVKPLTLHSWIICLAFALAVIPLELIRRGIMKLFL